MRTVTIDTNAADHTDMIEAAQHHGLEVSVVTVTDRELSPSDIRPSVDARILDTFILGDNQLGKMVFPSEMESALLEQILHIISNSSFPSPRSRNNLTHGQRHQFRDALILLAHVRERRDFFVSNDRRAFVNEGRREKLERLLSTRIMTPSEFLSFLAQPAE